MTIIRKLFFIPFAIITNAIVYTLVQIFFSFQTLLKEFNFDNIMQNPTIYEDVLGQAIGALAFFWAGFYIAPSKNKKYRIALAICFFLVITLNTLSIFAMNQHYRLLGILASIGVAYYCLTDNEEITNE